MQKPYIVVIGVSLFFAALFAITTIHSYNEKISSHLQSQMQKQFSALDLLATDVPPPWKKKETDQELIAILDDKEKDLALEHKFESGISREQLGVMGWTLLHMMSATLPETFDSAFVFKLNVYLNLFGQFYPCKECASHFLQMVSQNPYDGTTREDFMQYLCKLHNFVNKRLQKEIYPCEKVHDRWGGYCGCAEELQRSIEKYQEKP